MIIGCTNPIFQKCFSNFPNIFVCNSERKKTLKRSNSSIGELIGSWKIKNQKSKVIKKSKKLMLEKMLKKYHQHLITTKKQFIIAKDIFPQILKEIPFDTKRKERRKWEKYNNKRILFFFRELTHKFMKPIEESFSFFKHSTSIFHSSEVTDNFTDLKFYNFIEKMENWNSTIFRSGTSKKKNIDDVQKFYFFIKFQSLVEKKNRH